MKPYIIKGMTLKTYSGRRLPLQIIETRIIDRPLRKLKDEILDAFKGMEDPAVDVDIQVKYL